MKKTLFEHEGHRAQTMREIDHNRQNYWMGYLRGLRRRYHGENFGTEDEHKLWLTATGDDTRNQRSQGYRDGYYGVVDWDDLPAACRTIRTWRGLSRDELGELCTRSGRTVERWEQGKVEIPAAVVARLREIYMSD